MKQLTIAVFALLITTSVIGQYYKWCKDATIQRTVKVGGALYQIKYTKFSDWEKLPPTWKPRPTQHRSCDITVYKLDKKGKLSQVGQTFRGTYNSISSPNDVPAEWVRTAIATKKSGTFYLDSSMINKTASGGWWGASTNIWTTSRAATIQLNPDPQLPLRYSFFDNGNKYLIELGGPNKVVDSTGIFKRTEPTKADTFTIEANTRYLKINGKLYAVGDTLKLVK